jgi:hypothetical protein
MQHRTPGTGTRGAAVAEFRLPGCSNMTQFAAFCVAILGMSGATT